MEIVGLLWTMLDVKFLSKLLTQISCNVCSMEKPAEVDFHLTEFDDIRFHIQVICL